MGAEILCNTIKISVIEAVPDSGVVRKCILVIQVVANGYCVAEKDRPNNADGNDKSGDTKSGSVSIRYCFEKELILCLWMFITPQR